MVMASGAHKKQNPCNYMGILLAKSIGSYIDTPCIYISSQLLDALCCEWIPALPLTRVPPQDVHVDIAVLRLWRSVVIGTAIGIAAWVLSYMAVYPGSHL